MTVKLLHSTPLEITVEAIRTCYDSKGDNLGPKDRELLRKIISSKHESTLEHIFFNFKIEGISRACLQELARHRIASYSVKSTRYTLKELKNIPDNKLENFLVDDITSIVKSAGIDALKSIKAMFNMPEPKMDEMKYALPESYKTSLVWSINARALRNFLVLRTSPRAHKEIRKLALTVLNIVCENGYEILFEDIK